MSNKKSNVGSHLMTLFLVVVFLIGLGLVLYPTVSDYINSLHQSNVITHYTEKIADMEDAECAKMLDDAREFNKKLLSRDNALKMTDVEIDEYNKLLDATGDGTIGYIEIPSIQTVLPIYHGTSNYVLQTAIGHLEWTSLPVGGESTHSVVSGHRGLPSAKLFTNLDKLEKGDVFVIRVLDEVLTYEVDQILIVEPDEVDCLRVEEGMDYCTLFTCTPYGINTHRLCVRGHRIANIEQSEKIHVTSEAMQIEPLIVAPVIAIPVLLLILIIASIISKVSYRYR